MKIFRAPALANIARTIAIALSLSFVVLFPGGPTQPAYATPADCSSFGLTGAGTPLDPMQITNSAGFAAITDCAWANAGNGLTYKVMNNVNLSGLGSIAPFPYFEGSLIADAGADIMVSGFDVSGEVSAAAGLFAVASGSAVISNMGFLGAVESTATMGADLGLLFGKVEGSVTATNVVLGGSLLEYVDGGTVNAGLLAGKVTQLLELENCWITNSNIEVQANNVGGFVGEVNQLETYVANVQNLTIDATNSQYGTNLGGLAGSVDSVLGEVSDVVAVNMNFEASGGRMGGIVGYVATTDLNLNDVGVVNSSLSISDGVLGGLAGVVDENVFAIELGSVDNSLSNQGNRTGGMFGSIGSFHGTTVYVEQVTISASLSSDYVGGIVGITNGESSLQASMVTGLSVPAVDTFVGGAFGFINQGGLEVSDSTFELISVGSLAGSSAFVGGVVGSQEGQFTASGVTMSDLDITADGDFIGGFAGYILNSGFTGANLALNGIDLLSTGGGKIGGFVGAQDESFTLEGANLFETSVTGNGMFVGGALGYSSQGQLSITDYRSTYSSILNESVATFTAGIAGSVDDAAGLTRVSLDHMTVTAADSFVSFGIGYASYGSFTASNISIVDSEISISAAADYVGGIAGGTQETAFVQDVLIRNVAIRAMGGFSGGLIGYGASGAFEGTRIAITDFAITSNFGDDYLGGLLGSGQTFSVSEVVLDQVTVSNLSGDWTGGLVGMTPGRQDFSSAQAENLTVLASNRVGGFSGGVGNMYASVFSSITLSGILVQASGDRAGGLSGDAYQGTVSGVVGQDIGVSGDSYVGGLIGSISNRFHLEEVFMDIVSVSAVTDNAGGIVGSTFGNVSGTKLEIRQAAITGGQKVSAVFGNTGASVTLSDVMVAFTNLQVNDTNTGEGLAGGVIGWATSQRVSLEDIAVGFFSVTSQTGKIGGVIGWATNGLSISNFVLQGVNLAGASNLGGVIGYTTDGIAANLGQMSDIEITASAGNVGGLAGFSVTSQNRISRLGVSDVTINAGDDSVGGLIGYTTVGTILTDVEFSDFEVQTTGDGAGGVLGFGVGTLTISRAVISNVSVSAYVDSGGLVGWSINGAQLSQVLIQNLETSGTVSAADYIGRISGNDSLLVSTQSYVVYGSSNSIAIADIAGSSGSASIPVAISASAALEVATFEGWDFTNYFGLRCASNPSTIGVRGVTQGLSANCNAPSPSNQSQVVPVAFVYEGPIFSSISPKLVSTTSKIVLTGSKLDLISGILVDGVALKFSMVSPTQLELEVPAGLTLGVKDLTVKHTLGSLLVGSAFEVVAPPVVTVPKLTITSFKGRIWVYFKNVTGKALVVKIGGKWHRVANNGTEVVSFTRKSVKGKKIQVSAYVAGIRLESKLLTTR